MKCNRCASRLWLIWRLGEILSILTLFPLWWVLSCLAQKRMNKWFIRTNSTNNLKDWDYVHIKAIGLLFVWHHLNQNSFLTFMHELYFRGISLLSSSSLNHPLNRSFNCLLNIYKVDQLIHRALQPICDSLLPFYIIRPQLLLKESVWDEYKFTVWYEYNITLRNRCAVQRHSFWPSSLEGGQWRRGTEWEWPLYSLS